MYRARDQFGMLPLVKYVARDDPRIARQLLLLAVVAPVNSEVIQVLDPIQRDVAFQKLVHEWVKVGCCHASSQASRHQAWDGQAASDFQDLGATDDRAPLRNRFGERHCGGPNNPEIRAKLFEQRRLSACLKDLEKPVDRFLQIFQTLDPEVNSSDPDRADCEYMRNGGIHEQVYKPARAFSQSFILKERLNLGRADKVVFRNSSDRVSGIANLTFAIADFEIGVMVFAV